MNTENLINVRDRAGIWIAVCFSLLVFAAPNVQAKIYKWIDANGNVQYSQTPPLAGQFKEVNPGPPPSQSPAQANRQLLDTLHQQKNADRKDEADKKEEQQDAASQAQQQQMCDEAKRRLTLYENNPAPRLGITQGGDTHRITEEERQSEIAKMQKFIGDVCEEQ